MAATWALEKIPPGDWNTLNQGDDYEVSSALACQVDGSITRLRWRRMTTNAGDKPDALRVWDVETESVLHTASAVPDDLTVGWQIYTLDDPVAVEAGQIVKVAMSVPGTATTGYRYIDSLYAPPSFPAGLALPVYWRTTAPAYGYPNLSSSAYVLGIDAEFAGFLPSGSWSMVASTSYNDQLKWEQPADKYRLNVTTVVQWRQANTVVGEDIRRVIGAWWPFSEGFKGQRFLIDAPKSELAQPNARRMDGLLLDTGSGSAGTVQAWVLT